MTGSLITIQPPYCVTLWIPFSSTFASTFLCDLSVVLFSGVQVAGLGMGGSFSLLLLHL